MNIERTKALLEKSQGRSEFAIVVFVDIRGYSNFSVTHDSIETAIFIKRFFLTLIEKYFNEANYVKPTGDGLLVVYNYSEQNFREISERVVKSCLKLVDDFKDLFQDDEMVNFEVPQKIGIGISRGTVCCLFSGKEVIDYSGKVLNLAARLMDIARPFGMVIDGQYMIKTLPPELQAKFSEEKVYIRGIHETNPITILYLSGTTEIKDLYKRPVIDEAIEEDFSKVSFGHFMKLTGTYSVTLTKLPKENGIRTVEVAIPHPILDGMALSFQITKYTFEKRAKAHLIKIDVADVQKIIQGKLSNEDASITLKVEYVAK